MTITNKLKVLIIIVLTTILNISCKNHIDKYQVQVDSLEKLPDNIYAYRGNRIYLEDLKCENYRIWFNLDDTGNVKDIFRIENFRKRNENWEAVIQTYGIDTLISKIYAQTFIRLSRKYKFGNILIDKANKVSFSYINGLTEQYVKALNDSTENIYTKDERFRLLHNGWFENVEQ